MRNSGVSCAAGYIDKDVHGWTGKVHRTCSVRDDDKRYDALLRLKQAASKAFHPWAAAAADGLSSADGGGGTDAAGSPAADSGGVTGAAGSPTADGGGGTGAAGSPAADGVVGTATGGGVTDARIEFTGKNSALEAQIEQLEERNADLEEPLQSRDSKFSSILTSFKHFASSLPSF